MSHSLEKIREMVFGKSGSIFDRVYTWLWLLALLDGGIYATKSLVSDNGQVSFLGNVGLFLLLATIVVQSWTIYSDLHKMEHDLSAAEGLYGPWLNNDWERVLRSLIVVCLLVFVGKVATLVASFVFNAIELFILAFDRPYTVMSLEALDANLTSGVFSWGGALSYALLCIWNVMAFLCALGDKAGTIGDPVRKWDTRERVAIARLVISSILMGMCCLYWVFYAKGWLNWSGEVSWIFFSIFIALWVVVFGCRYVDSSLRRDAAAG